jgi:ABC-2 type transport system ATP-binding protein
MADSNANPAAGGQPMIEAIDLCKHYGSFAAVDHMNFTVRRGEVVAFLGPNGAGKSTTMKVLTGYLTPTSGAARLAGIDVVKDRIQAVQKLGYLPENGPLYPEMTPRELLQFFADARGMTSSAPKSGTSSKRARTVASSMIAAARGSVVSSTWVAWALKAFVVFPVSVSV